LNEKILVPGFLPVLETLSLNETNPGTAAVWALKNIVETIQFMFLSF